MNSALSNIKCLLLTLLVLTISLLMAACDGSSDNSNNDSTPSVVESDSPNTVDDQPVLDDEVNPSDSPLAGEPTDNSGHDADNSTESPNQNESKTTLVEFEITVPAYQSDALQVELTWGPVIATASWITDESWTVSQVLPSETEHPLIVMFFDDNGATTLGSFETTFNTGTAPTQSFQITADQFETAEWDDDGDGISNLDEQTNEPDATDNSEPPVGTDTLLPVPVTIELVADKTFRISWERSAAADTYRVLENPDGVSGYSYVSDYLDASINQFDHRVALHKRVNARYMVEACNAEGCTLSVQQLVEVIEPTLTPAIGYFKASNTGPDEFGESVSISADGNTMVIGAPEESSAGVGVNADQSDDSAPSAGAAYVFARQLGTWRQTAYLKASNAESGDRFGVGVSLSSDGKTIAVSATGEESVATGVNGDQSDNSAQGAGAVYVFVQDSQNNWQQQAYIKASNTDPQSIGFKDLFGTTLALSADGNTLVVGATGEDSNATGINGDDDNNNGFYVGAAYVFERNNGVWQQQAYVKPMDNRGRFFGQSLSLSGDGSTLAVGVNDYLSTDSASVSARGPDDHDFYGAVYIYIRRGGAWEFQAFLRPDGSWFGFGDEVSLSANGNQLAVSRLRDVFIFERTDSVWQQQAMLSASNGSSSFGDAISLSDDGSTLAVGARFESGGSSGLQGYQGYENGKASSGAAFVFTLSDGIWHQIAYVKASNSKESIGFGISLDLSETGDSMVVGASWERSTATGINGNQDDNTLVRSGAIYLY